MEAGLCEEQLNQADTLLQSVRGRGREEGQGGGTALLRRGEGVGGALGSLPGIQGVACWASEWGGALGRGNQASVPPFGCRANSGLLLWAELVSGHEVDSKCPPYLLPGWPPPPQLLTPGGQGNGEVPDLLLADCCGVQKAWGFVDLGQSL
jgi:hypothetical protein